MAQQVVVEFVDDLDGTVTDDISTVIFGLDGAEYEIDLTEENATRLRDALEDFVAVARRIGGRVKRGTAPGRPAGSRPADREQTKVIREWARHNGFEMSERGRISSHVVEAFEEAHAVTQPKKGRGKAKEPMFSA